ncbi:hypothetical protein [Chryseobacterium luquanense]|uniref:Uncharacterized protein n=1 Tax=Chryseobacterium luquanense TaxID=2983766 RepID=A0ABT3Y6M6_9FLAO|nr:hypothetical protein [Chryseobacterium luquanense]MCX8533818.1 hypothetical protein [Chryseobacterium luquanense]
MGKTKILFSGLLFILLFFTNSFYAQSKDSVAQRNIPKPTIVLKDGATLFSTDDSFNGQISNNKIVHDKASIANQVKKNKSKTLEMVTPKENKKVTKNREMLKEADKNKIKPKNSEKKGKKETS